MEWLRPAQVRSAGDWLASNPDVQLPLGVEQLEQLKTRLFGKADRRGVRVESAGAVRADAPAPGPDDYPRAEDLELLHAARNELSRTVEKRHVLIAAIQTARAEAGSGGGDARPLEQRLAELDELEKSAGLMRDLLVMQWRAFNDAIERIYVPESGLNTGPNAAAARRVFDDVSKLLERFDDDSKASRGNRTAPD